MKKILFMIPSLSVGGAEKVLVNLVNNMDKSKFDITVQTLFGGGVNEQFLDKDIKYKYCFKKVFRGNSKILKLFPYRLLFKNFIKGHYDVIVSYLEGPTARIVAGCQDRNTKLVSWIHIQQENNKTASYAFRNYEEAKECYSKYDRIVCVSEYVKQDFQKLFAIIKPIDVLYNTNETQKIIIQAEEPVEDGIFKADEIKICVVGKISKRKGCDRVVHIQKKLLDEGFKTHVYFLGNGIDEDYVHKFIKDSDIEDTVTLLGYQTNPYKYLKKCNLFICASLAEGFSTAATEALILGVPVVTVEVSGMKEMLGENGEFGFITENNEEALYKGIVSMLTTPNMLNDYSKRALERGKEFSTEKTTKAVEKMFLNL